MNYLLEHLSKLEDTFARHHKHILSKKYLICRDGYLYTGVDDYNQAVHFDQKLMYSYKINTNI